MPTQTSIRTFPLHISTPGQPRSFVLSEQLGKDVLFIQAFALHGKRRDIMSDQATVGLRLDNEVLLEEDTNACFFVFSANGGQRDKFYYFRDRHEKLTAEAVRNGRLVFTYSHNPTASELLAEETHRDAYHAAELALAAGVAANAPLVQLAQLRRALVTAHGNLTDDYDVQLCLLVTAEH